MNKIYVILFGFFFGLINASDKAKEEVAEIEISSDSFYIKDRDRQADLPDGKIGDFKIQAQNATRNPDSSISFKIRMYETNYKGDIYLKEITGEQKLEDDENEEYKGKTAIVTIPKEELKNETFEGKLKFKTDNPSVKFERVKFKVKPNVFIKTETKTVDFGKLDLEYRKRKKTEKSVKFQYSILANSRCYVSSEHDFRMKHTEFDDKYIDYDIKSENEIETIEIEGRKEKKIKLKSAEKEFNVTFVINELKQLPLAGTYNDVITFSLTSRK